MDHIKAVSMDSQMECTPYTTHFMTRGGIVYPTTRIKFFLYATFPGSPALYILYIVVGYDTTDTNEGSRLYSRPSLIGTSLIRILANPNTSFLNITRKSH